MREELERVRGELAAAEVKVTSTETQLRGLESAVTSKEALHQQLKVDRDRCTYLYCIAIILVVVGCLVAKLYKQCCAIIMCISMNLLPSNDPACINLFVYLAHDLH